MWRALLLMAGFVAGSLVTGLSLEPAQPPAPVPNCSVAETAADRCDKALLTCLSVQVRFIRAQEDLEDQVRESCGEKTL